MKCPNCGKSLWFLRDFCVFCKSKLVSPPRPTSVTVIGWLAVVIGFGQMWVLYLARHMLNYAEHPPSFFIGFINPGLIVVSGLFLMRGMNWARWVLVIILAYNQISQILKQRPNFIAVIILAAFGYFLFRPAANAFFSGSATVSRALPPGQEKCGECGKVLPAHEMIRHGRTYICAACKPIFLQKLSEGAATSETNTKGEV